MRHDVGALARCVGDPEDFLATSFDRSPRRRHAGSFDDLLSLGDIDAQLTGAGLRWPAVRLVRDGVPVDRSRWTRSARTASTRLDDLVDAARVLAEFDAGATVVLQSLQRWWPPLARFCEALADELGHSVQANAYLTPAGAAGLAPHHDTHDVFVLQVHGTKHWILRDPVLELPMPRHRSDPDASAEQPVRDEFELVAGDSLYLPRGTVHSAAAQRGASLHLTIGVLATTAHDVMRRVVELAADEPSFRRTVTHAATKDPDAARSMLKGLVAELAQWLDGVDAAEFDDPTVGRLLGTTVRRTPRLDGHLIELVRIDRLDERAEVVRREGVASTLRDDGSGLVAEVGDRRIELPAGLRPAVELLLDGSPHEVSELGAWLDGPSSVVLVRRLVREGLLRRADAVPDGA